MPKFMVMSSTIGCSPAMAAPMARPVKPACNRRIDDPLRTELLDEPLLTLNAPW